MSTNQDQYLENYGEKSLKRVRIKFLINYSFILFTVGITYGIIWHLFNLPKLAYINYFLGILYLVVGFAAIKKVNYNLTSNSFAFVGISNLYLITSLIWDQIFSVSIWYVIIPFATLLIFDKRRFMLWSLIGLFSFITIPVFRYFYPLKKIIDLSPEQQTLCTTINATGAIIVAIITAIYYRKLRDKSAFKLQEQFLRIKRTKDKLIETQQYKERFFANISHEIRTPLNAIVGVTELLEDDEKSIDRDELVSVLKKSSNHLLSLVNDMLDFSKLQEGKLQLIDNKFDIRELISSAMQVANHNYKKNPRIEATWKCADDVPQKIYGDSQRLFQILLNLLSNSFKFTHDGKIELVCTLKEVREDEHVLNFMIIDTGSGMSIHEQKNIFNPYYQGMQALSDKNVGTGLGLNIVTGLVKLFKGELKCESEKGKGTTFTISIPFKSIETSENTLNASNNQKIKAHKISYQNTDFDGNILVVDDNKFNRLVATKLITKHLPNASFETANDGLEAIKWIKQKEFDVVLMDISMPNMNGLEATTYVRNELNLHVPIVALSANISKKITKESIEAGMNDYLQKPFSSDKLIEIILRYSKKNKSYKRVINS